MLSTSHYRSKAHDCMPSVSSPHDPSPGTAWVSVRQLGCMSGHKPVFQLSECTRHNGFSLGAYSRVPCWITYLSLVHASEQRDVTMTSCLTFHSSLLRLREGGGCKWSWQICRLFVCPLTYLITQGLTSPNFSVAGSHESVGSDVFAQPIRILPIVYMLHCATPCRQKSVLSNGCVWILGPI